MQLTVQLWSKNTFGHIEVTDDTNEVLWSGKRMIRVVELMGNLQEDLFLEDHYIFNGISVNILFLVKLGRGRANSH